MNIITVTEWLWNNEPEGRENNYLKEALKQFEENNAKNRNTISNIQNQKRSLRDFQKQISEHNE